MFEKNLRSQNGFTLAELLIVVAVVAVLTAISIPVFASRTAKAKAATDMENIRSAKAAATVQYLTNPSGKEQVFYYDAESGTITNDSTKAASFRGYGKSAVEVDGASGLPVKDGKAQIVSVTVKTDGSYSASWGLGSELDTFLSDAIAKNKTGLQGNALINAMGTLPSVATSDIFGSKKIQNDKKTLYWRPKIIQINGKNTVILYANSDKTGNAANQGFAIYYNGKTYRSTRATGYQGRINPIQINSISSDFDTYVSDPKNGWEEI